MVNAIFLNNFIWLGAESQYHNLPITFPGLINEFDSFIGPGNGISASLQQGTQG